jgi:hypothetical protein
MGFGAIITTGKTSDPLSARLTGWIVEARIEQELSKPTRFAIRFEDELCAGSTEMQDRFKELKQADRIGIFAASNGQRTCLVLGPITQVRNAFVRGGPGSWFEIHGQDVRVEMDRLQYQAKWSGKASDIATQLIAAYGFGADCETTTRDYSDKDKTLNQRGSDLALLEEIARRNVFELWVDYDVPIAPAALNPVINVRLRASPPRDAAPKPAIPALIPDTTATIEVNPPPGSIANVTRFDVHIDYDHAVKAKGLVQDIADGTTQEQTNTADQKLMGTGRNIVGKRNILAPPVPDPADAQLAQQAALTEAAWFVEVNCSSTVDLLGFVPLPHKIVTVAHAGPVLSGAYQVKKATHVINASSHFVDFAIRANGIAQAGVE